MNAANQKPLAKMFCPACGHDVATTGEEPRVRCPGGAEEHALPKLWRAPGIPVHLLPLVAVYRPLPRGFLPLMAACGLSPALLLVFCVLLTRLGGAGSPARVVGALLGQVSLLGMPVIFAWGALELRRRSQWLLRLGPGLLTLLLAAANVALALAAFTLIEVAL